MLPDSSPGSSNSKRGKKTSGACSNCHSRKVRCDASIKGGTCTNCHLDGTPCVVPVRRRGRKARAHNKDDKDDKATSPRSPQDILHGFSDTSPDVSWPLVLEQLVQSYVLGGGGDCVEEDALLPRSLNQGDKTCTAGDGTAGGSLQVAASVSPPSVDRGSTNPVTGAGSCASEMVAFPDTKHCDTGTEVSFSEYPFLKINNLDHVQPETFNYLASQHCLSVPEGPLLDVFVRQYFLHVHPLLPLINEAEFWDIYLCRDPNVDSKLPLVVFQAMLFASCSFVPESTVAALRFLNIRAAREGLYQRAKLLYDLETETSQLHLAQAALLLTLWAPNPLSNTTPSNNWSDSTEAWLTMGIHNARRAGAHAHTTPAPVTTGAQPAVRSRQNQLRRLWCCCVIRDAILALGLRRNLRIKPDSSRPFPELSYTDLAEEIEGSKVYDATIKSHLVEIVLQLAKLCSVLSEVIPLVYPPGDILAFGPRGPDELTKAERSKEVLEAWCREASTKLQWIDGKTKPETAQPSDNETSHDPVVLYTSVIYLYYYSARTAVCHHKALQLALLSNTSSITNVLLQTDIYDNQQGLKQAVDGTTECLKSITQLGITCSLPIMAVTCIAWPLVLRILNTKLSSLHQRDGSLSHTGEQGKRVKQELSVLLQAISCYHPRYDTVDYICTLVRHVVSFARPESGLSMGVDVAGGEENNPPTILDWTDNLLLEPGYYLHLSTILDLSLSRGRLASDGDIPTSLQSLFKIGLELVEMIPPGDSPQNLAAYA